MSNEEPKLLNDPQVMNKPEIETTRLLSYIEFFTNPDNSVGYRVKGSSLEEAMILLEAAQARSKLIGEERVREAVRLRDLEKQLLLTGEEKK